MRQLLHSQKFKYHAVGKLTCHLSYATVKNWIIFLKRKNFHTTLLGLKDFAFGPNETKSLVLLLFSLYYIRLTIF